MSFAQDSTQNRRTSGIMRGAEGSPGGEFVRSGQKLTLSGIIMVSFRLRAITQKWVGTMPSRKRLLFVDDEPSIRLTLPPVLQDNGFEVATAASVADALIEINSSRFDVLISDLNIGEAGDGFLVVSAMRHIQPHCLTIILTGYPAFETALQAIRHQVDDYLVKPTDLEVLLDNLQAKLSLRNDDIAQRKRLGDVLRAKSSVVVLQVLEAMRREPQYSGAPHDESRLGHLEGILEAVIALVEAGRDEPTPEHLRRAAEHGKERTKRGFRAPEIITDFEILQGRIFDLIQADLMNMDPSNLLSDLKRMQRAFNRLMKHAITVCNDPSYRRATA
jgi:ActR/RegA family two-component response regulator